MISANSRKLLGESWQWIIAVTTNLFNSPCTLLRFICSIPFNLRNIRLFLLILHGWFLCSVIVVQFHSIEVLLHCLFTSFEATLVDFIRSSSNFLTGVRYIVLFHSVSSFLFIFMLWDSQSEQNERTQISRCIWVFWAFTSWSGTEISSEEKHQSTGWFFFLHIFSLFRSLSLSLIPSLSHDLSLPLCILQQFSIWKCWL